MKHSYIYILTDEKYFKVGISKNPVDRVKELQTGSPNKIRIITTFKLPADMVFKLEKECHNKLQTKFIKRGEWFHGATEFYVKLIVDEICEEFVILDE